MNSDETILRVWEVSSEAGASIVLFFLEAFPMKVVKRLFSPRASTKVSQAVDPEGPDIA